MNPFLDASQAIAFARQLEEIDAQLYDVKYAPTDVLSLVDAKPLAPGAQTYTWRSFDERGVAEITANYASGSPRVDVGGSENSSSIFGVRDSYGFNIQEIRAAAMMNFPLESRMAEVARKAINRKLYQIAMFGDAEFNIIGLFNQPQASSVTIAADGTGASKLWSTKSGTLMLRDMLAVVDKISTVTSFVESANRLLLPSSQYLLAASTQLDAGVGVLINRTVLEQFKVLRPGVEVVSVLGAATAGAAGVSRMLAYRKDPDYVRWILPIPFESFPPQYQALQTTVECHARTGGVVSYYPLSMAFGDGI